MLELKACLTTVSAMILNNTMRRTAVFLSGLLVLFGCNALEMNTQAREIRIDCEVNTGALTKGAIILDCVATNIGDESALVLPWNTPLESKIRGRFLQVQDDKGEELGYRGLMVKRAAPQDEDYLTINVGESIASTLDLTNTYNFCSNSKYQINYSSTQAEGSEYPVKLWMPRVDLVTPRLDRKCDPNT